MKKGLILFAAVLVGGLAAGGHAHALAVTGTAAVVTPITVVNATTTTTTVGVAASTTGATVDMGAMGGVDASATADLTAVAGTIQSENAAVASVDTTSDANVAVKYMHPARLFGFIPVTLDEQVTVSADPSGRAVVSVTKPWWSFLAASSADSAAFASAIQTRLDASASTMNTATVDGKLPDSSKAYLLTQIEAGAEATYSAGAQAQY